MELRRAYSYDDVLLVTQYSTLYKRKDADISSWLFDGVKLNVPIISANMPSVTNWEVATEMFDAGGIGALPRINLSIQQSVEEFLQVDEFTPVIVSIGLKDWIERSATLYSAGARFFLIDVAHGNHEQVADTVWGFRQIYDSDVKLIVGNFVSINMEEFPLEMIDAVKVGIGPGAACRTREVTGFGVPQLTAIMDMKEQLRNNDSRIKIIADGGIKNSGDIVKALAAGADTVMIGRLLAGCVESPGGPVYYGNASAQVNGHRAPEGVSGAVEAVGTVSDVVKELAWGIRSGLSYGGATNLEELRENAEWIEVSSNTMLESSVRI